MKVIDRVLEVDDSLDGDKVAMTIDQSALAHIMSILTDLYSDPTLAVIREYSTNAYDAHIEAGVERPIEITTPTSLSPFFKIRDYGNGLNAQDIYEIYSRYGASTKRDSDDVVGMLGLGCKSALTYTDQFTLTGIKDGICTQVSVSRDEDGAGSMTIVDSYETDEPSGTEVLVPVKAYNEFAQKSADFFRFWSQGTVVVNGEEPKQIDGLRVHPDLLITEETGGTSYVVMGNVPYEFANNLSYAVVAFVPIGAVQFTPSRESLQMTKRTTEAIKAVTERVEEGKLAAIQRLVDAAPDKPSAALIALDAGRMLSMKDELTYEGKKIPVQFDARKIKRTRQVENKSKPGEKITEAYFVDGGGTYIVAEGTKGYKRKSWYRHDRLPFSVVRNHVFITGYDASKDFTPNKRAKLTQWQRDNEAHEIPAEQRGQYGGGYVLVDKLPHREWIDPSRIIPWQPIEDTKVVREYQGNVGGYGRPQGSYKGYVAGSYSDSILAANINLGEPIYWTSLHGNDDSRRAVTYRHPKCTIIQLPENRKNKFQRDFPQAKRLREAAEKIAGRWAKKLTEADVAAIRLEQDDTETKRLRKLDVQRIDDPDLRIAIEQALTPKSRKPKAVVEFSIFARITNPVLDGWKAPSERYPLLDAINWWGSDNQLELDHAYLYLNAAYAAEHAPVRLMAPATPAPIATETEEV